MLIKYDVKEVVIPNLNGGKGSVSAKMFLRGNDKVMISRLPKGSSIGSHKHESSSEMNFVLSGVGLSICDGVDEPLSVGCCCICPLNSTHCIENTGDDELVLFTIVAGHE